MIKSIFNHRVFRNSSALIMVQFIGYLTPLFVLAILTKRLGFDSYSLLAYIYTIIGLGNVFVGYGFYLSATEKISVHRHRKKIVNHVIGSVLICQTLLLLIVITAIVLYALINVKYSEYKSEIMLSTFPLIVIAITPTWFFQGIEKMKSIAIMTIVSRVINIILLLFFVTSPSHVKRTLIIYALTALASTGLGFILIYRNGYRPEYSIKHAKLMAGYGFQYFITRIAVTSYTSLTGFLLGVFGSLSNVGIFFVAEKFYLAIQSLFISVYHAIFPFMAKERDYKLFFNVLKIELLALFVGIPFAYFIFPLLIEKFTTSEFISVIMIFNIFLILLIINVVGSLFGYPFFVGMKKNKIVNKSIFFGSIVHIIVIALLIISNKTTAVNFVLAAITTESVIFIYRLYFVHKTKNIWSTSGSN